MRVTFLGAARTVTGSQHLVGVNGHKILLDCGLYQGRQEQAYERNSHFEFDPKELEAVILTHAHIDHSGNLPTLVKQGYQGPIYATHVTAHLAEVMLQDAGHIQEEDVEYLNQKRKGRGQKPVQPLYTRQDAEEAARLFEKMEYDKPFEAAPGVTVRLVDAGHILGSAAVVLDAEEQGGLKRLWYSGDIGRLNLPLVNDPVLPQDAEALIMECTYGDRSHTPPEEAYEALRKALVRTLERGGKVVIPAFAVGRTQELVYDINQMLENGEIPEAPVYVDSPLAVEVSKIFHEHPQYFDREAKEFILSDKNHSALTFDRLTYVQSVQESRELNDQEGPMVIISASGMAESGRILHHLIHTIGFEKNAILIVSYQAPDTLGRDLEEGATEVEIFGDIFYRKAEVMRIHGFSAHAGKNFLFEYGKAVKGQAKQVFLVHGEEQAAEALRKRLQEAGLEKVYYPYLHQSMEI